MILETIRNVLGKNRTLNPQIRSLMLYPIKLQAHFIAPLSLFMFIHHKFFKCLSEAEKGTRTLNLSLGKAILYHLSYFRLTPESFPEKIEFMKTT